MYYDFSETSFEAFHCEVDLDHGVIVQIYEKYIF